MFCISTLTSFLNNNKDLLFTAEEILDIGLNPFPQEDPIKAQKSLCVIESLLDHLVKHEKVGTITIRGLKYYFL